MWFLLIRLLVYFFFFFLTVLPNLRYLNLGQEA